MFDKNGYAKESGLFYVEHYDTSDGRWLSSGEMWLSKGQSLPEGATTIERPPRKQGFAAIFDGEKWSQVEDHRGKEAYNIKTKEKERITYVGKLKEEHTLLPPPSHDHEFIGGKWVLTDAKKAELKAAKTAQQLATLEAQKQSLIGEMQMHSLLGETEEAKTIAQKVKEINEAIEQLKGEE